MGLICGASAAQAAGDPKVSMIPRSGPGYTNGWYLMTPQERQDYRAAMSAMPNVYACRAYVEQHHRLMVERAKATDSGIPPPARLDVCDGLPE